MASGLNILYLTHDLSDPATYKRTTMLRDGGAKVTLAGFRRTSDPVAVVAGCPAIDFGRTYNRGFVQRTCAVLREIGLLKQHKEIFAKADVIIARNLEMLAIGVSGRALCSPLPVLVYECLDIHRLLLSRGPVGVALRALEARLSRCASALVTSSPAFVREYFTPLSGVRLPIKLMENKVYLPGLSVAPLPRKSGPPWKIGWFGAIRCRKSLDMLSRLARESNGAVEVIIRGRPSLDQFDDFYQSVKTPGVQFLDAYTHDQLSMIYTEVHFTWAIDMFEEGLNSSWLLPNRLYEGCAFGSVPIADGSVETGRYLKQKGLGVALPELGGEALARFFDGLTPPQYAMLASAVRQVPSENWAYGRQDCVDFVSYLGSLRP